MGRADKALQLMMAYATLGYSVAFEIINCNSLSNNGEWIMYKLHNPKVRAFGQRGPKEMEQVITFVFASIRVQTSLLPRFMKEWRKRGMKSSWIWGNKRTGLRYVRKNRNLIFSRFQKILRSKNSKIEHDLIMLFLEIPGLGIPKAGFVTQLLSGKSGCLDVHNIRRYLPDQDAAKGTPAFFQTSGNTIVTKSRKVEQYMEITAAAGGSRSMWNTWCNHIAMLQPKHFATGYDVSELHVR